MLEHFENLVLKDVTEAGGILFLAYNKPLVYAECVQAFAIIESHFAQRCWRFLWTVFTKNIPNFKID